MRVRKLRDLFHHYEGKAKYRACPAWRDGHCGAFQGCAGITAS